MSTPTEVIVAAAVTAGDSDIHHMIADKPTEADPLVVIAIAAAVTLVAVIAIVAVMSARDERKEKGGRPWR